MSEEAVEPTTNDWHNVMCAIAQWVAIKEESNEDQYMFDSLNRTSEWIWKNKINTK